jgi:hypothetical protein
MRVDERGGPGSYSKLPYLNGISRALPSPMTQPDPSRSLQQSGVFKLPCCYDLDGLLQLVNLRVAVLQENQNVQASMAAVVA